MRIYYSVDRFENGIAVLIDDDEKRLEVSAAELPEEAGEGSIVYVNDGAYVLDLDEEVRRRTEIAALLKRLEEK